LGRTLKQSAAVHHQLHLGWTNIAELLYGNIYHFIFIEQRFQADGILLPNLRQARKRYLPFLNEPCDGYFL